MWEAIIIIGLGISLIACVCQLRRQDRELDDLYMLVQNLIAEEKKNEQL